MLALRRFAAILAFRVPARSGCQETGRLVKRARTGQDLTTAGHRDETRAPRIVSCKRQMEALNVHTEAAGDFQACHR